MKNFSSVFSVALCTLLLFSAVAYTSCHKEEIDKCNGVVCYNGGTCVNGVCKCPDGYALPYCSLPVDFCESKPCLNGGWCTQGKCNCTEDFAGKFCEINLCTDVVCLNGGHCAGGKCKCAPGYRGTKCDTITRTKYIGTWKSNPGNAILIISDSGLANITQARMSDPYTGPTHLEVVAEVTSEGLEHGPVYFSGGFVIEWGEAIITGDEMHYRIKYHDNGSPSGSGTSTTVYTRQ